MAQTAVRSLVQNMPDDFLLRNINNQDVWVSETPNEILEIKEDSHVRIRVANVQLQPEKLVRSSLAACWHHGMTVQHTRTLAAPSWSAAFIAGQPQSLPRSKCRPSMFRIRNICVPRCFVLEVFLAECGFNDGGAVQGGVATLKGDYLGVLAC